MRDVIQKVMTTEMEAKRITQAARAEADRIVSQAHNRARELVQKAHELARREAEDMLSTASVEFASEKSELLCRAAAEINHAVRLDDTTAHQCAEAAVRCIRGFSSEAPIVL